VHGHEHETNIPNSIVIHTDNAELSKKEEE